jgi:hypothetical protein
MRFLVALSVPMLLGACSNTVTSTRDGQSNDDSNAVQSSAPETGTHRHTVTDADNPITELRQSCASRLNELPVDAEIAAGSSHAEVSVDSHAVGEVDCADFAWVRAFVNESALIEPEWNGPDRDTEWDCNHSSLEYAVYRRLASDWEYVGGGLAYGQLDDGSCRHSVDNFPAQVGSDAVHVQGSTAAEVASTEVRVAVRAWTHNDPAYGHAGNDCDALSCFWPASVRWEAD